MVRAYRSLHARDVVSQAIWSARVAIRVRAPHFHSRTASWIGWFGRSRTDVGTLRSTRIHRHDHTALKDESQRGGSMGRFDELHSLPLKRIQLHASVARTFVVVSRCVLRRVQAIPTCRTDRPRTSSTAGSANCRSPSCLLSSCAAFRFASGGASRACARSSMSFVAVGVVSPADVGWVAKGIHCRVDWRCETGGNSNRNRRDVPIQPKADPHQR